MATPKQNLHGTFFSLPSSSVSECKMYPMIGSFKDSLLGGKLQKRRLVFTSGKLALIITTEGAAIGWEKHGKHSN